MPPRLIIEIKDWEGQLIANGAVGGEDDRLEVLMELRRIKKVVLELLEMRGETREELLTLE